MCTVLLLLRPGHEWPLLLGSNRDERLDRAFEPPGRWWPDAPGVIAWRDVLSGGSWLGVNDHGVVATLVNRMGQLGPLVGKATRGELVIRALREADATRAAHAVASLPADHYGGFTLLIADRRRALAITNDGRAMRVDPLADGLHLVTPEGYDVPDAPRYVTFFPALRRATPPDPGRGLWSSWIELLQREDADDPHRAMTVTTEHGFGTVASTLVAVPKATAPPVVLYATGPPTRAAYERLLSPGFVT